MYSHMRACAVLYAGETYNLYPKHYQHYQACTCNRSLYAVTHNCLSIIKPCPVCAPPCTLTFLLLRLLLSLCVLCHARDCRHQRRRPVVSPSTPHMVRGTHARSHTRARTHTHKQAKEHTNAHTMSTSNSCVACNRTIPGGPLLSSITLAALICTVSCISTYST